MNSVYGFKNKILDLRLINFTSSIMNWIHSYSFPFDTIPIQKFFCHISVIDKQLPKYVFISSYIDLRKKGLIKFPYP